mmetsp:Transcript_24370/g.51697  ORF Transcript_24370/g.51697 Transcript_24370/m.51697 type:complete len:285 (-) Transcript_24370:455-1309(-)
MGCHGIALGAHLLQIQPKRQNGRTSRPPHRTTPQSHQSSRTPCRTVLRNLSCSRPLRRTPGRAQLVRQRTNYRRGLGCRRGRHALRPRIRGIRIASFDSEERPGRRGCHETTAIATKKGRSGLEHHGRKRFLRQDEGGGVLRIQCSHGGERLRCRKRWSERRWKRRHAKGTIPTSRRTGHRPLQRTAPRFRGALPTLPHRLGRKGRARCAAHVHPPIRYGFAFHPLFQRGARGREYPPPGHGGSALVRGTEEGAGTNPDTNFGPSRTEGECVGGWKYFGEFGYL